MVGGNDTREGWILDVSILPGATLRQGDLIKFENESKPMKKAGIVVTADCDLEKKKHAKTVTLVPVVAPRTVLEYYILLDDCEQKRQQIADFVWKKFSISEAHDLEVQIALLRKLASGLDNMDAPERVAVSVLLDECERITMEEYRQLMLAMKIKPKGLDAIKSQITKRGDLLVLPDTKGLGIDGCIAWVRHVWQVPVSDVAIKTSQITRCSGERIARLDSPYRYRLTQLMAQVFSDIGLPDTPKFVDQLIEEACGT